MDELNQKVNQTFTRVDLCVTNFLQVVAYERIYYLRRTCRDTQSMNSDTELSRCIQRACYTQQVRCNDGFARHITLNRFSERFAAKRIDSEWIFYPGDEDFAPSIDFPGWLHLLQY